ncbi:MAG: hypothetical protein NT013_29440 [Planctomycetia bacterium]|nr:hypothetical protein [Planctomycetia bacterium]
MTATLGGCHREFYRKQADDDARKLVEEKSCDPRWAMPGFNIEMNPASRYYDQYDPVKPPMPPDDPESHELMHCVYGKKGWSKWHENGDRSGLENPTWQQCLDQYVTRSPSGAYVLQLEDSMRLAVIHSPTYQQQLETLYLSSLDVSTERFRLQTQFFGGNGTFYNHKGPAPTGTGVGNSSNSSSGASSFGGTSRQGFVGVPGDILRTNNGIEARRRFATAGELVVGFANSFVWQFAGPDQSAAASIAGFSFLQPLLRAGGRVVGLERLTLAERTLLAGVRSMYRYRQGFFTQIAIGNNGGITGPQRRGGFTGAGLEGFSGQGTSGFAGQGDLAGLGGGGNNNAGGGTGGGGATGFAGGGAATQNGFLGLLQRLQQIRNLQELIKAQARTRPLLEANLAAGLIDIAQVDQFRQNIETERANMLDAKTQFETQLDQFKVQTLGLPPHVPIELNDSLIKQFQFIDPDLGAAQDTLSQILSDLGDLKLKRPISDLEAMADRIAASRRDVEKQLSVLHNDLQKLDTLDGVRFKDITPEDERTTREEWVRLKETRERLIKDLAETGNTLSEIRAGLTPESADKVMGELVSLAVYLDNLVKELSLVQARSRLEIITVEPVELHPLEALAIARCNRVDWMNNRAALIDTWRLIEFNANALETGLDIVFSGDVGTTGNNPTDFAHTTGNLRAGLRFDAPFTRLNERNIYRAQLIAYQQARRRLINFEDTVHQTLRVNLRQLNQQRANLEIQRRAMAIAIRRVDERRENLNKPVAPAAPGAAPQQFGPTAARDLLDALSDLRSVQNNVMSVWLDYYAKHMTLIRDLGVMQLDENGLWVAQPLDQFEKMGPDESLLPPVIPDQWFKDLDAAGRPDAEAVSGPANGPTPPAPAGPTQTPVVPDSKAPRDGERGAAKPQIHTPSVVGRRPRSLNAKTVSEAKVIQPVDATEIAPLPTIVPRQSIP